MSQAIHKWMYVSSDSLTECRNIFTHFNSMPIWHTATRYHWQRCTSTYFIQFHNKSILNTSNYSAKKGRQLRSVHRDKRYPFSTFRKSYSLLGESWWWDGGGDGLILICWHLCLCINSVFTFACKGAHLTAVVKRNRSGEVATIKSFHSISRLHLLSFK